MGLNAAVYRNVNALRTRFGVDALDVDPETGEAMLKLGIYIKEPRATFIALEQRLGNVDGISKLRTKLSVLLDESKSILLRNVLYSGTHGGDVVKSPDFAKIKEEIVLVRNGTSDPSVIVFVRQMEELVDVAITEDNPIVFV